jgi:hypothetical protein
MSARSEGKKKKLAVQTLLFGAATAALYAAVFANCDSVMEIVTRGGYYAAIPIATVFLVSYFHGTFSSNLWSVLGIEAVTKQPAKRPAVSAPGQAQRPRPRVRMNA